MHIRGLQADCVIILYFASTRQAPILGLAAVGSGTGHDDSHLGFSVNSLEISLSQEETEDSANLLNNCGAHTLPVALCNNNHCSVISLKHHQWLIVWNRQSVRETNRSFTKKAANTFLLMYNRASLCCWKQCWLQSGTCCYHGKVWNDIDFNNGSKCE